MLDTHNLFRIIFFFLSCSSLAQNKNVFVSPTPSWVHQIDVDLNATPGEEKATGHYYLLLDDQHYLKDKQFYSRYTYKILNSKGVQDMADININFDPEYQTVHLHKIKIIRDGRIIEKLDLKQLKVIQRETSRERFLYDGRLTIMANLTDIRIGDIVDYAYTIRGANPIFTGKYHTAFALQYNLPIQKIHFSITVPRDQSINFRKINEVKDPKIMDSEYGKLYSWEMEEVSPINYENQTPSLFDTAPAIEVTQFGSWGEVVDQFQKYYTLPDSERKKLNTNLPSKIDKDEENIKFIDRAIRFVQDEVRYLGFENGMNSHKPSNPKDVLERRYGDCKDKSFLLSEILQARGIKAFPMLVHSEFGKDLNMSLPSPGVFDHCVVEIDLGNNDFRYIDPTISDQGGTVDNIYFPDYGYGLVLKPGETTLRKLPEYKEDITEITETFELDDIVDGGAFMEVKTIYRGRKGDIQRDEFASVSRQDIQEQYLNFYKTLYPTIKAEGNLRIEDKREDNEFIVHEKYRIDSLWEKSVDNPEIVLAEFYPLSLQSYLNPEISSERKMPYQIVFSENIVHKTVVFVPEEFNIENESFVYNTDDFTYSFDAVYKNARLEITHKYKTLTSHLEPENIQKYLDDHIKARDNLSFVLSYNSGIATAALASGISWWSVILVLLVMGATGYFSRIVYNKYDIPSHIKPRFERKIGGWLVLIAIGLTLTPVVVLSQFLFESDYFNQATWSILMSTSENYLLGFFLLFEMVLNSAYIVFSILVVILFYKRRTIAPRIIIIFMAVTLLIAMLDAFVGFIFSPLALTGFETQEYMTEVGKRLVQCMIWIPYFIYSKRVEETFTKTRKPPIEDEIPEPFTELIPAE